MQSETGNVLGKLKRLFLLSQHAVQRVVEEAQTGKMVAKPGCTLRQTFENEVCCCKSNYFVWFFGLSKDTG